MNQTSMRPVLFDLDGTLADTAADLAAAANAVRQQAGLAPLPLSHLRPQASAGARGLLKVAMNFDPHHAQFETAKEAFLDFYSQNIAVHSQVFAPLNSLLEQLDAQGRPWGIVTNKFSRFTFPLLDALALSHRAGVVVCGDTLASAKPSAEPCLYAASALKVAPEECIMIGDDERDILSGRGAGMTTIGVRYGYASTEAVDSWGADWIAETPEALCDWLLSTP